MENASVCNICNEDHDHFFLVVVVGFFLPFTIAHRSLQIYMWSLGILNIL